MNISRRTVLSILPVLAAVPYCTQAGQPNPRAARIILFVPEGSALPAGHIQKLRSIAVRAENFFADGIEKWGWKVGRREIFARDASGKIEINVVQKKMPEGATGNNALLVIQKSAIAAVTKQIGETAVENGVWWTFYHCPNHEVRGFRGGGGRDGGRAVNAYPDAEGTVTPNIDLADKAMWPLNLKGCIHEFGHALGLPHIGPKPGLKLGNTLMGPINKSYASTTGNDNESRVYLSQASATMLAKHPIFSASPKTYAADSSPVQLSNLSFQESTDGKVAVSGTVLGKVKVHSAVVLDTERSYGDYWARTYCAKVNDKGEFSVAVNEPFDSSKGMLALYFCLEDGRNTGTGKREVMTGDYIEIQYEGEPGQRKFTKQAAPTKRSRKRRPQRGRPRPKS